MKVAEGRKLIAMLEERFARNMERHRRLEWSPIREKLESQPAKLRVLYAMETSGGEPDVVEIGRNTGEVFFVDCSEQSPAGRRSLCYDREALDSRKKNKPEGSALELASQIGIELLDETQYRKLQSVGEFDTKTSSWIATPGPIRELGGALFCDRRYGEVFVYHNGAESYYAARGFRGFIRI